LLGMNQFASWCKKVIFYFPQEDLGSSTQAIHVWMQHCCVIGHEPIREMV
jgi:hypothetical protein